MKDIEELAGGLQEISRGNLAHRVSVKSEDEIGSLAYNINNMAQALQDKIEKERQIEKDKNEMITNISHDLRTPLTSTMGYVRLVKAGQWDNKKEMDEHLQIAYGKSEQLKVLFDNLFEYPTIAQDPLDFKKEIVGMND